MIKIRDIADFLRTTPFRQTGGPFRGNAVPPIYFPSYSWMCLLWTGVIHTHTHGGEIPIKQLPIENSLCCRCKNGIKSKTQFNSWAGLLCIAATDGLASLILSCNFTNARHHQCIILRLASHSCFENAGGSQRERECGCHRAEILIANLKNVWRAR